MVFLVFFYVYRMRILLRIFLLVFLIIPTLAQGQHPLRVALASSLVPAMEEIKSLFESQYKIKLELIPGASGTLTNQIIHGAPYDIFISANQKYSDLLYEQELLIDTPIDFIRGSLILWSDQPLNSQPISNQDELVKHLNNPEVQTVAIAQPGLAPYGDAAQAFLLELGVYDEIKSKLIFGNNASITNQYIYTKGANIVITSLASKIKLESIIENSWYEIETNSNLIHTLCRLKNTDHKVEVLTKFLLRSESKSIFIKYGYSPIVE